MEPAPLSAAQRILQTAQDHFLAHGFSRITMDDLAAELGMSKRTLYRHFPAKTDLLHAVLDQRLQQIRAQLEAVAADPDLDFASRLRTVLTLVARRLAEVKPPFLEDLRRHAPDSFRRVEVFRRQLVGTIFSQALAEGRRQGMVRRDLNQPLVIEILLNLIHHTINPDALLRLELSPGEAFDTVMRLVLEGVLTPAGRNAYAQRHA